MIVATPIDLSPVLKIMKPWTRALYELEGHEPNALPEAIVGMLAGVSNALVRHPQKDGRMIDFSRLRGEVT